MFLEYYGFREQPFGVTPDPAYLYLSRTHTLALDALSSGIRADRGFMAIVAEPGMGKTTLLYHLLEQLRDSARTVFLFQTQCNSREFFGYVLSALNIDTRGMNLVAMHDELNNALFREMLAGKRFVLVVDEAQNLEESVLETIRLLSDFETPHAKLLQIVLAGQPRLAEKLARPGLAQLRQRIAILSRLDPLSPEETARYIHHRLRVGGYAGGLLFAPNALAMIAERSQGIPRNINNLCFNALSLAYAQRSRTISPEIVQQAAAELDLKCIVRTHARSDSDSAAGSAQTSVHLTYQAVGRLSGWRRAYAGAALGGIFLLGSLFLFASPERPYGRGRSSEAPRTFQKALDPTLSDSSAIVPGLVPPSVESVSKLTASDRAVQDIAALQFLVVAVGPQDTPRQLSLRYLGRFDQQIFNQICALNPELKDPNQVEAGQLIRLPLPDGTLKKGYDTAALTSVSREGPRN